MEIFGGPDTIAMAPLRGMDGVVPHPEDHTHWTTEQWRARCHLWRGEPSWRCLTFFTKDHALFLGITSVRYHGLRKTRKVPMSGALTIFPPARQVLVLIIVFLKDLWADYHPTRTGTMAKGREDRQPAERPSTPRTQSDALAARIKGARQVGSSMLPGLFQAKKE